MARPRIQDDPFLRQLALKMGHVPGSEPRFALGECARTKSGLEGKVIGSAEFIWGWEHRLRVPGRKKTLTRKERDLRPC